ncbi:class I SAM-dependent methyltransferase [Paenibacillus wenxiniae]|uniref:Class I SAM-dependent methyltransferase n=1 Tax=Paenibacillus wenxiniae TaxID=1636843 RepID=A0ABW4RJ31_9BACL
MTVYPIEFTQYLSDDEQHFSGWDFAWVSNTGRIDSEPLDWSYVSLLTSYMVSADCMLDMGTGGGELLSMLRPLPRQVFATEAYAPNVPIARKRLEPLGITVKALERDDALPFADNQFDLVLNRHESYDPAELWRIMKPGAHLITQQVGGTDCTDINDALGAPHNDEFRHWTLAFAVEQLQEQGFRIIRKQEQFPIQRFYDIGALIYYLKAIEWQIPGFAPAHYMEQLYSIHLHIAAHGYFDVRQNRFLLIAERG